MALNENWFTEICAEGGSAFSLELKDKIHEERTAFQLLEIYETRHFGRLMTLDGLIMLTDRDNFIYHEMITHPALFSHPDPKRVLIIGGGDCGSLREVLKHGGVELAEQVEIDERVTRAAEKYFPELCESNNDPRARFRFTDGIRWVAAADPASYDVIIIDSTDPIGPAAGLFSAPFYASCRRALTAEGILIAQSESPLFHLNILKRVHAAMREAGFHDITTLHFPQCSYPSGWWSTTMACKHATPQGLREHAARQRPFSTRYYNAAVHAAAAILPQSIAEALAKQ